MTVEAVSTAFLVRRRPGLGHLRHVVFCANDCTDHPRTKARGLPREATHEVLICGYPTLVCASCARQWKRMWAAALDFFDEPSEHVEQVPRFVQPRPQPQLQQLPV